MWAGTGAGPPPQGQDGREARSGRSGRPPTVDTMPKTTWSELLARFPTPHLVVALLPGKVHLSAHPAQQLLVRLLKKLPTQGDYAVTISRRNGQQEILCGFSASSDAALLARATDAATAMDAAGVHSFVLDGSAAKKLLTIAGPPEKRRPRATAYDRWQS